MYECLGRGSLAVYYQSVLSAAVKEELFRLVKARRYALL